MTWKPGPRNGRKCYQQPEYRMVNVAQIRARRLIVDHFRSAHIWCNGGTNHTPQYMASMKVPRSGRFENDRIPLHNHDSLQLIESKVDGPVNFLNPTRANYQHQIHVSPSQGPAHRQPAGNIEFSWTSRNNRKGRHAIITKPPSTDHPETNVATPRPSLHWKSILYTTSLMIFYCPIWDISWCVAYIFTWGSILWVINAFFAFYPLIRPSSEFHNESLVGGGVTAFIGATIFEIGSILLMLEAVNENREGCFGWAVKTIYHESWVRAEYIHLGIVPKKEECTHHHPNKKNLVGKPRDVSRAPEDFATEKQGAVKDKSWIWCPSWTELRTHYFHELGFIASLSQLIGATIFWISGFTALPGIYNNLSPGLVIGVYWVPQVLGGCGFIISGLLFMIETQKHWWLPAPKVLGWHIGLWNLVGGIGFTLCPAFGLYSESWAQYQASCSTFWASWAFLIGSVIQLYESLDKTPVEKST